MSTPSTTYVDHQALADKALAARELVGTMTAEEKTALLTGNGMWKTARLARLGVEPAVMTDGTYGVRYSVPQIDGDEQAGTDLDAFLSVVQQRASEIDKAWGQLRPATCFPNGSAMGCSWDIDLMAHLGVLLGRECRTMGIHTLLGPGINIRRTPLAGRSYEYYSEDPLLTGKLAAAVITGIQDQGVGTSLKHFAGNNSEMQRTSMDSVVDARALREIYLRGFQMAIRDSDPWTVMSSYNRLNGVQAAEDPWLLTQVLRRDWAYDGLVMSDWNGIKDRAASLTAGNELDMPESPRRKADLLAAIRSGELSADVVDAACVRVLDFIARCHAGCTVPVAPTDLAAHHVEARRMAAASMVLLKNDGAVLPVAPTVRRVLVVGRDAETPVIQGSGCATTMPTQVDEPLAELRALLGPDVAIELDSRNTADDSLFARAAAAHLVVVFASTEGAYDGEGSDRSTLALGPGQDALITALADHCTTPMAVVVACPDAVAMPWADRVGAVLVTFYSGQAMGGAVADVLTGRVNPSGKLSVTFPHRLGDVPGFLSYPGEQGRHLYSEGIHVGYRGYDFRHCTPLFPFGHGRSYTTFRYADLQLSASSIGRSGHVTASFSLHNTGTVAGAEVAQVYLRAKGHLLRRSPLELKGFAKVVLAPGETRRVDVAIDGRDLTVWDPVRNDWVLEAEDAELVVAASSRDLRLAAPLTLRPSVLSWARVSFDSQPAYVIGNPVARPILRRELAREANISPHDADVVLDHCANSFIGIFPTLERRLRITVPNTRALEILTMINTAMDEAELKLQEGASE
ncbi:beta-glucosidase-like glycosyl hydrolase [Grosmannia clavigera kw1407]|uniref:beta-glucosidase n=1 Tax=Grosmannia clavigera (strain kw1407 / UAMH 11150) TaxID=655863 RepID=F0XBR0_GROCL|nr:beta-glucosidase-like glycosyl hydrolase [Grosmannia clavigera kw1407]EFX04907.1 beta-glucosidase-like glycosyl hydrolase [Grosmannia clavigera kw1407]